MQSKGGAKHRACQWEHWMIRRKWVVARALRKAGHWDWVRSQGHRSPRRGMAGEGGGEWAGKTALGWSGEFRALAHPCSSWALCPRVSGPQRPSVTSLIGRKESWWTEQAVESDGPQRASSRRLHFKAAWPCMSLHALGPQLCPPQSTIMPLEGCSEDSVRRAYSHNVSTQQMAVGVVVLVNLNSKSLLRKWFDETRH